MSMGFRLSLAVVLAAALFAVSWAVCDQLAGLGVAGSSAAAGVVAIVAFGLTLRATRPERLHVRHLGSAHVGPNGLRRRVDTELYEVYSERAARSGEGGRELPEKPGITRRSTPKARDRPTRDRARTVVSERIKFIVDDAELQVRRKRRTIGGEVWEEYLRIQWSTVRGIGFATGRHDPIVALYAWTTAGRPYHVADSQFLSHLQWIQLGELITEATRGRLTLDVDSRHNPRSIRPDW
jgi:hypothetical protein